MIDHATRFWRCRPAIAVILTTSAWFWLVPLSWHRRIESTQAPPWSQAAGPRPGVDRDDR